MTMSNIPEMLPEDVTVTRSDPVYMAHGYLTKVPIAAIQPYIEAFTKPGDVVLDLFAGSGMTGVAAATLGRSARLCDVSVLGRHIGSNYVNIVDSALLTAAAELVIKAVRERLSDPYMTTCRRCGLAAETVKVVESAVLACGLCGTHVSFYESLEAAGWSKSGMKCTNCSAGVNARLPKVAERAELESIDCCCTKKQLDQAPNYPTRDWMQTEIKIPSAEIAPDRQMFVASALGKHGMTTTRHFFSNRNAVVLAALHEAIANLPDEHVRSKMMFAFTAILPRASKRYQWSKARPLNAANANYYVAPVFYEWNVFDLFDRKVGAAIKSDAYIRSERARKQATNPIDVEYHTASAVALPFDDSSIDYVFTDPPFGWNIFYSDMNLFQEAWLVGETVAADEAVIDRTATAHTRTSERYEAMLVQALRECQRVLRPGGWVTVVFGNSSGVVWEVVQRAILAAGLFIDPRTIASLDKGQRSVKGLSSGFENVATHDLILSLRPIEDGDHIEIFKPTAAEIEEAVQQSMASSDSPSHLYIQLLKSALKRGWALGSIDLKVVTRTLLDAGYEIDSKSGKFVHTLPPMPEQTSFAI